MAYLEITLAGGPADRVAVAGGYETFRAAPEVRLCDAV